MTSEVEPAKKILLPYLQRADELQKHEPLVAYYSRLYAMERGLKIPVKERTKTTNAILVSLMKQLEKDKKSIQVSPEDNLYVEGFALNVFAKADKQDRAGRADLNTAKTFYAASIFIEILHQFGPLQPDIEQKQKYAVWKAADIRKALSEGRKPVPGPPVGDDNASTSPGSMDLEGGSPRNTTALGLHGRSSMQDNSTEGFEVSSLDSESRMDTNPSMQQHDHQYAAGPDQRIWQQTGSTYTSAYPGSFHPVPSMPEDPLPSSMAPSQHGSTDDYNGHHGSMDGHYSAPIYQEYPQIVASQYGSTDGFNVHHGSTDGHHGAPLYQHGSADGFNVHHGSTDGHPQATASRQMYMGGPTHYIAGNEAADAAYYQLQGHAPSAVSYSAAGTVAYPAATPFSAAEYCSVVDRTTSAPSSSIQVQNYQPTSENIADAQKAARLSVSALAFDDVPTAVSYLKQSLELLTARAAT